MYCRNCGAQLRDDQKYCTHCGAATPAGTAYQAPNQGAAYGGQYWQPARQTDPLIICGFVFAFICAPIGLVLCIIGMAKHKGEFVGSEKGLAVAGIVISSLMIVVGLIYLIWALMLLFSLQDNIFQSMYNTYASSGTTIFIR